MLGRARTAAFAATLLTLFFTSIPARAGGPPPHAAITITSDADLQSCACVTSGSGTATNPYVIGPWAISTPASGGWAVKVDNSKGGVTKYFNITGIQASYNDYPHPANPVIWVVKVTKATTISGLTANQDGTGVQLDSDANVTLDSLSVNLMSGMGVLVTSSTNVSIANSKLKAFENGFDAENSSFLNIGTSCGTNGPFCNEFTYDDGRGLVLTNTHDVVVNSTTTSADDTAGMLLDGTGTYNVEIKNSQSTGNGSICPAGTPTGQVTDTAGGIRLVNGAHDNYIHDFTAQASTGGDIMSGGDGFWINSCTGQVVSLPKTAPMGANNRFANLCYTVTNIPNLPPKTCKN